MNAHSKIDLAECDLLDSYLSSALEHLHQCRLALARVDAAEYLDDRLDALWCEISDVRNAL